MIFKSGKGYPWPRYESWHEFIRRRITLSALATKTGIQIWDARIGQRLHVIQSRGRDWYSRPVAFSPKGELLVSDSDLTAIVESLLWMFGPVYCSVLLPSVTYHIFAGTGPIANRDKH